MRLRSNRFAGGAAIGTALAVLVWSVGGTTAQGPEKLKEGQPAPQVKLPATQIESVLPGSTSKTLDLQELKGKKNVVLFFYPRALTGG